MQILWTRISAPRKYAYKTLVFLFSCIKMHAKSAPKERRTKWCEDCSQLYPKLWTRLTNTGVKMHVKRNKMTTHTFYMHFYVVT